MDLTTLFLILAGIVVVGLIIYFLSRKKGPTEKPEEKEPEAPSPLEPPSPPEAPIS